MKRNVMKTNRLAIVVSFFVVPFVSGLLWVERITATSPPTASTETATLINSDSFTYTATLTGTVNPNGTDTYYRFEYGQTTTYGFLTVSAPAGAGTSTVPVSMIVSGDIVNTPDHFRILAYNWYGTSYGSDAKIPDAFEPNNKWKKATDHDNLLVIEMINNFHEATDIDWIKIDLTNTANEHSLQFYDAGADCDITVSVYVYENEALHLIAEVNEYGVGQDENVWISPPINGPVYIKMSTLAFGEDTEYKFRILTAICDVGFLTGTVSDAFTGGPVQEASIYAEAIYSGKTYNITSLPDGTYYQVACVDSYNITVTSPGYNTFNGSTDIPSPLYSSVYDINLSSTNSPPIANAGPDQKSVRSGDSVTLDASGSDDPDDGIDTYLWIQTGGLQIELSDPDTINPSFVAPQVDGDRLILTFQLTVTDFFGYSDNDVVKIYIYNFDTKPMPWLLLLEE